MSTARQLPDIIKEVGFDFRWDEQKVWQLDVPSEEMPITELTWHFDVPFLWKRPDGFYDVYPRDVIQYPGQYTEEYARTLRADTTHPIDIMYWRGRWLILDGLHRLMRQSIEGKDIVKVRKIPQTAIPLILKDSER